MEYVNLHHHSTFSFGDGHGTPAKHVARAAELGYRAMALTEHGYVSSHVQLEKACKKAGIKAIFGLEAYCGEVGEKKTQWKNHLTILAKDVEGYQNLNRIVTQSFRDHHYHPTVSGETLGLNSTGLVVLSGCAGSLLACTLLGGKGREEDLDSPHWEEATAIAEGFRDWFGEDYYLEIQPFPELPKTCSINASYERLGKSLGVPLVVTCDVHYPTYEDREMQAVLHSIHRNKASVDDAMREWNYDVPLTLPATEDWLWQRLVATGLTESAATAAIATSLVIADKCNVELPHAERLRYPISEEDMKPWTA